MKRIAETNRQLAAHAEPAQQAATVSQITFDLSLVEDSPPPRT